MSDTHTLPNREGQRVPEVVFPTRIDGQWQQVTTADLFAGKKVIVFSLPGAFTPTCSTAHVPRYNELEPVFKAHGVDAILCVSVNDTFVMNAWKKDQDADNITFVPDGNGDFSAGMGLLVDKTNLGFGKRSWRYSMVVNDGVITKQFLEPDVPGDPYGVSDADTMLAFIAPDAAKVHDVLLLTKPGCSHCARAKKALAARGIPFEDVTATPRMLRAVSDAATTPQVFIDSAYIGGADDLERWLEAGN